MKQCDEKEQGDQVNVKQLIELQNIMFSNLQLNAMWCSQVVTCFSLHAGCYYTVTTVIHK